MSYIRPYSTHQKRYYVMVLIFVSFQARAILYCPEGYLELKFIPPTGAVEISKYRDDTSGARFKRYRDCSCRKLRWRKKHATSKWYLRNGTILEGWDTHTNILWSRKHMFGWNKSADVRLIRCRAIANDHISWFWSAACLLRSGFRRRQVGVWDVAKFHSRIGKGEFQRKPIFLRESENEFLIDLGIGPIPPQTRLFKLRTRLIKGNCRLRLGLLQTHCHIYFQSVTSRRHNWISHWPGRADVEGWSGRSPFKLGCIQIVDVLIKDNCCLRLGL